MTGIIIEDDYIDPDVAYLLGLIVARGQIIQKPPLYEIVIGFPMGNLHIEAEDLEGVIQKFDIKTSIQLGMGQIRERLIELMDCDVKVNSTDNSNSIVLTMTRRTMAWRNIMMHLEQKTDFRHMSVPKTLFHEAVTSDVRLEFIRGFADVAANMRRSNNHFGNHNRVRLDVLNDNWDLPIQLCLLMQQHLEIPVQSIIWGHPNMNREFREHMINVFVEPFQKIGSTFNHKQQVLNILTEQDKMRPSRPNLYSPCPGRRRRRGAKDPHPDEISKKLPDNVRQHFDAYWQICKAVGCTVEPEPGPLFASVDVEVDES